MKQRKTTTSKQHQVLFPFCMYLRNIRPPPPLPSSNVTSNSPKSFICAWLWWGTCYFLLPLVWSVMIYFDTRALWIPLIRFLCAIVLLVNIQFVLYCLFTGGLLVYYSLYQRVWVTFISYPYSLVCLVCWKRFRLFFLIKLYKIKKKYKTLKYKIMKYSF